MCHQPASRTTRAVRPCVRENIRKASGQCIFYRKITRPADSISKAVSKVQEGRKRPMSSDDHKFKRLPRNEGVSTKAEIVSPGKRKRVEKVVAMEMDSQQAVKLGGRIVCRCPLLMMRG